MLFNLLVVQTIILLPLIFSVKTQDNEFEYDPSWVAPDAWSRQRAELDQRNTGSGEQKDVTRYCQPNLKPMKHDGGCEKEIEMLQISEMFYKRLAKLLFNKQRFKVYIGSSVTHICILQGFI